MPAYELYGKVPYFVVVIRRAFEAEETATVVGHFSSTDECREWAEIDGSAILTHGVHKPTAYRVMSPPGASRVLTGRYVTGGSSDSDGFFSAGHGVVERPGETRDGVHTVVLADVQTQGGDPTPIVVGIFASSQDARLWVNLIDSFYPRLKFGEAAILRPVLTPEEFIGRVDEFRLKGEVAFT